MASDANTLLQPPADPGTPADEAAAWAAYLYSGEATEAGRAQFSRWLDQSAAHVRAYRRVEHIWRRLDMPAVESEADLCRQPSTNRITVLATYRKKVTAAIALAATLLIAAGVWRIAWYNPIDTTRYTSRTSEIKTLTLEDGSRITLGPASVLVANFSNQRREVELTRGGAYFDVASDKNRPFIVRAQATEIRVVGTEFDVTHGAEDLRISVTEGVVDVSPIARPETQTGSSKLPSPKPSSSKPPPGDATPRPNTARLTAGQRVFATRDGTVSAIQAFDPASELAWREGRLVYRNARLADVIAEINRYRDLKIVLADQALEDMRITTAFRVDETDKLLTALEVTRPVTVARSPQGVLIRPKPATPKK